MSSITTSAIDTPTRRSIERTCDDLAFFVLALVGLIAGLTFRDYGLGWDDYTHAEYADLLLRMYGSGFQDTAALSFANLYMYGGGFDMVAALLHKVIPLELFETRRLLGAIVGLIGLAVTWRLARRIGGPLAGLAALLLLALCPIYLRAHVHEPEGCAIRGRDDHPDDGPGAAGRGISASLAANDPDRRAGRRAFDRLARPRRAGADLCADRLRCRCCSKSSAHKGGARRIRRFVHVLYVLLPGLVLGYLVMGLIWPWSIIEARQSVHGGDLFLAFLRKALEGDVRRRAGLGAGHAVVLSADPVRASASRSAAWRCSSRASS